MITSKSPLLISNDIITLKVTWNKETEEITATVKLNLEAGMRVDGLDSYIHKSSRDANFSTLCQTYNYTPADPLDSYISIYRFKKRADASALASNVEFPRLPEPYPYTLVRIPHLIVVELLSPAGGVVSTIQGEAY
jgi:hypothetical protein